MRAWRSRRFVVAARWHPLGVAALVLASCGGTSNGVTSSATVADAPPSVPGAEAQGSSYTVLTGDSIIAIADRWCVSSSAIVAANSWSDGLDHVIHPGDRVTIPSGACEPASQTASMPRASSTAPLVSAPAAAEPVDSAPEGTFYAPFWGIDTGDGFTVYPQEGCDPAFVAIFEFQSSELPAERLLTALAELGEVPPSITDDVATFASFRAEFFAIAAALDVEYGNGAEGDRLADPEYQRMVTAGSKGPFDAMQRILAHVRNQCPVVPNDTGG